MRINVGTFGAVVFSLFVGFTVVFSQTTTTSRDVMRERVMKAKAYVAVKNYNAAIYELDGIRRESNDPTVLHVADVILMNCLLEQGDSKRALNLLTEHFNKQKLNKQNSSPVYFTVAGQVVKSAKTQLERYRSLGLNVNDRNLPLDAVNDLENTRQILEVVIEQSKELSHNSKAAEDSFALLEESSGARSGFARDDFDAKRWKNDVKFAREHLANSRSVFLNAADDETSAPLSTTTVASNGGSVFPAISSENSDMPSSIGSSLPAETKSPGKLSDVTGSANAKRDIPIETSTAEKAKSDSGDSNFESRGEQALNKTTVIQVPSASAKKAETDVENSAAKVARVKRDRRVESDATESVATETTAKNASTENPEAPVAVGSLLEFATQKVSPVYPVAAKTIRMGGVVRVEVLIGEDGRVASVQNTSGPAMLQRAAHDAVLKWKFKPFVRDGQPVKAMGYVSFNFAL